MADYLQRVYLLTLKWDEENGAMFILRAGDIISETIHNATIRLAKPTGGYVNINWDRKEGTLFNYIATLPNSATIALESDADNFIDEAKTALDKYFRSTLSHDEKLFIKAFEIGFIDQKGNKTELGVAFDNGFVDKDGKQTKLGKEKLEKDGKYER